MSRLASLDPSKNSQPCLESAVQPNMCLPGIHNTEGPPRLLPDFPQRRSSATGVVPSQTPPQSTNANAANLASTADEDLSSEHFAEQAGGTVRKRVSAHFTLLQKQTTSATSSSSVLPTSASVSSDLSRTVTAPPKPFWTSSSLKTKDEAESIDSKENSGEDGSAPPAIKRGSIAARVAAFESATSGGGLGTSQSSTASARPAWARK